MFRAVLAAFGICLGLIVVPIDFSIVYTALPAIQTAFGTSLLEVQWIMNIYGVIISVFLVSMGRLADAIGRRKLYLIGVSAFGLFSLVAAFSPSIGWLIGARAFQGLAAAMILPVSQALITSVFPKESHGKAIGIWAGVIGSGMAAGPFLGGVLISAFDWRSIFFLNIPFTVLGLLIMLLFTKEIEKPKKTIKVDWKGLFLLTISIASLIIAVVQAPEWGWVSGQIIVLFILAVVFFILFAYFESRSKEPIISFRFYRNRTYLLSSMTNSLAIFFVWGGMFLVPLYLFHIKNFSPLLVGFTMLLITIPFSAFSPIFGSLLNRMNGMILLLIGMSALLLSSLMQIFGGSESFFWLVLVSLILFGIGWALIMGPSTSIGLRCLPPEDAALASGAWITTQEIFGSLGLAVVGSIVRMHDVFMQGYESAFIVMSILLVIGLLVLIAFSRR